MTRRAYRPRPATVALVAAILARPGVASVTTIAPSRGYGASPRVRQTQLRVTLDRADGFGRPIHTDFTLPEARAWLAADTEMEKGNIR